MAVGWFEILLFLAIIVIAAVAYLLLRRRRGVGLVVAGIVAVALMLALMLPFVARVSHSGGAMDQAAEVAHSGSFSFSGVGNTPDEVMHGPTYATPEAAVTALAERLAMRLTWVLPLGSSPTHVRVFAEGGKGADLSNAHREAIEAALKRTHPQVTVERLDGPAKTPIAYEDGQVALFLNTQAGSYQAHQYGFAEAGNVAQLRLKGSEGELSEAAKYVLKPWAGDFEAFNAQHEAMRYIRVATPLRPSTGETIVALRSEAAHELTPHLTKHLEAHFGREAALVDDAVIQQTLMQAISEGYFQRDQFVAAPPEGQPGQRQVLMLLELNAAQLTEVAHRAVRQSGTDRAVRQPRIADGSSSPEHMEPLEVRVRAEPAHPMWTVVIPGVLMLASVVAVYLLLLAATRRKVRPAVISAVIVAAVVLTIVLYDGAEGQADWAPPVKMQSGDVEATDDARSDAHSHGETH